MSRSVPPWAATRGAFASLSAVELASTTLAELVARTGLREGDVDDVILGNCYPSGENPAIGRIAALDAGLGTGVPGLQIDRRCGSGLQAVLYAAGQVATGAAQRRRRRRRRVDVQRRALRAGPAHRRTKRQRGADGPARSGPARRPAAGTTRSRAACWRRPRTCAASTRSPARSRTSSSVRSQQRAGAAHDAGRFADELVPGHGARARAESRDVVVDRDEHPRPGTTLDRPRRPAARAA